MQELGTELLRLSMRVRLPIPICKLTLLALLCAGSGAQTAGPGASAAPSRARVEINGTVINSVSGEPVRRALVLLQAGQQAALTDGEGRFHFEVQAGIYARVGARKPGYLNDEELGRNPRDILATAGGENLIIKLTPQAVITGNVSAQDGEPLEGVRLRAIHEDMLDGRKMWQPRGFGRTDENGEFRIANLPPGNFYLVAEAKAEGSGLPLGFSARAGQAKGYPLTYFPDTFDESSATILHLAGGEEKRANFLMHAVPLYSVSGMVTGVPEGAAASVQFIQAGIPLRGVRFDRTTGKFQMQNIPAGTYTLAAEADNEKGFLHDQKQITVNGDVSNLQLALESGISIPVNVQRIVTRPQEKTEAGPVTGRDRRNLNEADDELPLTIRLWPSPSTLTVGAMGAISSQSASKISIQNVLAGRYSVEAAVESPWYVESIRRGGLDLAKEELVVSAGEQEPMDVVLRDDSATLRGQVHWEGQPTEGGGVLVMPDAGRSPFTITTSPEGKFAQTGVPPGGYRVLPFEDLNAIEYRNREALRPYLPKATHVTLQPNQTTTMELEEIRKEE